MAPNLPPTEAAGGSGRDWFRGAFETPGAVFPLRQALGVSLTFRLSLYSPGDSSVVFSADEQRRSQKVRSGFAKRLLCIGKVREARYIY